VTEFLPPLYAAILDVVGRALVNDGDSVSLEGAGLQAWQHLSPVERAESLPALLGAYTRLVHDEETSKRMERRANDSTHTYLDDLDTTLLWEATQSPADRQGQVRAERNALLNVLCELDLLQHRLAMRDADPTPKTTS
jgi:hypothetical protein